MILVSMTVSDKLRPDEVFEKECKWHEMADWVELGVRDQTAICHCCDGHPLKWLWLRGNWQRTQISLRLLTAAYCNVHNVLGGWDHSDTVPAPVAVLYSANNCIVLLDWVDMNNSTKDMQDCTEYTQK